MIAPHEKKAIIEAIELQVAQLQEQVNKAASHHKKQPYGSPHEREARRNFTSKEQQLYGALKVKEAVLNTFLEL